MSRKVKEMMVKALSEELEGSSTAVLVELTGTAANDVAALRSQLMEDGIKVTVVKNSLAKIVVKDTPLEPITDYLGGSVSIVHRGEGPVIARRLVDWQKKKGNLEIFGGVLDGSQLSEKNVMDLSTLPDKDTLRSQVLATVIAPATSIATLLNNSLCQVVNLVSNHIQKKEEAGDS